MVPFSFEGKWTITEIAPPGAYTVEKVIASLKDEKGNTRECQIMQKWPVKVPIQCYAERLRPEESMATKLRTIDTFLDQIVFGVPVTGFDLWQVGQLHETSRRRNNECGLDVIVVVATRRATTGGQCDIQQVHGRPSGTSTGFAGQGAFPRFASCNLQSMGSACEAEPRHVDTSYKSRT